MKKLNPTTVHNVLKIFRLAKQCNIVVVVLVENVLLVLNVGLVHHQPNPMLCLNLLLLPMTVIFVANSVIGIPVGPESNTTKLNIPMSPFQNTHPGYLQVCTSIRPGIKENHACTSTLFKKDELNVVLTSCQSRCAFLPVCLKENKKGM